MSRNAKVVIIGAGVSGRTPPNIALGMGADVTLLDTDLDKLRMSFWRYNNRVHGLASSQLAIQQQVTEADMVIGAVLIPGAKAPKLVSNDLVAQMKPGSVLVDIAVDQGGCFEDTRPTTHADPTYQVHNSIFYCVANMPGAVPEHVDLRAHQRDPAVRRRAGRQGLAAGAARRPLARARPQHPRRRADLRAGRATAHEPRRYRQPRRGARLRLMARRPPSRTSRAPTMVRAVRTYLDHLAVERGLAANTLASYRRDLRRYLGVPRRARCRRPRRRAPRRRCRSS